MGPAKKMAEWAGEVGRAAEKVDQVPSGMVRVTASPFISFDFLAPLAGWMAQKHPALRLVRAYRAERAEVGATQ